MQTDYDYMLVSQMIIIPGIVEFYNYIIILGIFMIITITTKKKSNVFLVVITV